MQKNAPKILLFDVETSPAKAWIWGVGRKVFISHEQIVKGSSFDVICIAYKWLHENKIHTLDWGLREQDSSKMIARFSKVIEEADLVVGHNVDRFDIRQVNTQRLLHGQPPIAWPTTEDTLKQLRKHFAFPSYKLDYISKILTGSGKDPMNFQDWIDIVENKDRDALDKMLKYCKRDVAKLCQVYKQVSHYLVPKMSVAKIAGGTCPRCGGTHTPKHGIATRVAGRFQRYQCQSCFSIFTDRRKLA